RMAQAQAVAVARAIRVEISLDLGVEGAGARRRRAVDAEARGLRGELGLALLAQARIGRHVGVRRLERQVGEVVAWAAAVEIVDRMRLGVAVQADRGLGARQAEAAADVAQHYRVLGLDFQRLDALAPAAGIGRLRLGGL